MPEEFLVELELIVPNDFPASRDVTVTVQVEDVSESDAPATTVAKQEFETAVEPGKHLFAKVEVPAGSLDPRRSYNVRAHVKMKGGETVQRGDLITTQSAPVLTHGSGTKVVLPLREVK